MSEVQHNPTSEPEVTTPVVVQPRVSDPKSEAELQKTLDELMRRHTEEHEEHTAHPFPQYRVHRYCLTAASRDSTEAWAAAEYDAVSVGHIQQCMLCDLAALLHRHGHISDPFDVENQTIITAPAFDESGKWIKGAMEVFVPKSIVTGQQTDG